MARSVLIYLTGGVHWMGGVQYTRNLLSAVSLLPRSERPTMVLRISSHNQGQGYEEEFGQMPGVVLEGPVQATFWDRWRHRLLGRPLPEGNTRDACRVAFPAKGPGIADSQFKIYWIPDFQYKNLPQFFPEEERLKRDEYYQRMHAEARLMVLSSAAVEKDYRKFFPEAADIRVELLRFCSVFSAKQWSMDPLKVVNDHELPERFLYTPNQIWQHKGHDTLFEAIAILKRQGITIPVVCTGNAADYRNDEFQSGLVDFIAKSGLKDQVRMLGLIPRDDQVQLFRRAALIVQPSRFEGWSTVVEDARAAGRPIIMSDIDVHVEQAPAQGDYFKVGDAESLAEKLKAIWPQCTPGGDPTAERQARKASESRAREFGRRFCEVVGIAEDMAGEQS